MQATNGTYPHVPLVPEALSHAWPMPVALRRPSTTARLTLLGLAADVLFFAPGHIEAIMKQFDHLRDKLVVAAA